MTSSDGAPSGRLTRKQREELLHARAAELFSRQGYASTSLADLARAVGVSKPMLYRHFDTKQELAMILLERYRGELTDAAIGDLGDESTPLEARVVGVVDAWLAWTQTHPDAVRLLFTPIKGDAEVERAQAELLDRTRRTQAALIRKLAPDHPDQLIEAQAEITFAALTAVALWLAEDRSRLEAAQTALVRLILNAVA